MSKFQTAFFFILLSIFIVSCSGEEYYEEVITPDGDIEVAEIKPPQTVSDSFKIRGTVAQIYVWSAEPDTQMELVDKTGEIIKTGTTDYQGSIVFRELTPGDDYTVRLSDDITDYTDQIKVMSVESSLPEESFYANQVLKPGYGYLTTRDGTKLSIFVSLPGPVEDGPYPTVVNYSGYSPSRPGQSLGGSAEIFCGDYPVLCDAPSHPSGIIAGVMGYATVGVNLRGTGCSGGAYDYFEKLQLLDGYDVIETVAHQSWVKHNKVGMVGLSFPGITQLFVASTKPPSLAAIAPFSVIADTATSTLVPGGIYNKGFALEWIRMVLDKADPYAHGWIKDLVEEGDTVCEENQLLHSQKLDAIQKALDNPYYTDDIAKPLDPSSFVQNIEVPVFLTGQTQDEQTGPHFPVLFDKFTNAPTAKFTITNGVHMDGFAPQILGEWFNFLAFYVAKEVPTYPEGVLTLVPVFMSQVFGADGLEVPPARFDEYSDYEQAKKDYESENPVRVIFESGAHSDVDGGAPRGTFEKKFKEWPIPEIKAKRFYFQPEGKLLEALPENDSGESLFKHDIAAGDRVTLKSGSVDGLQPNYILRDTFTGMAVNYVSEPLTEDLVMAGHASVDLWLKTPADDADLEATITEVRPDGKESFIQNGWLRASHRNLKEESTELRPISSHYKEDVEKLTPNEWTELRIEMMPFVHIFRKDSRIRLTIDTPGDSCARWRFLLLEYDKVPTHSISNNKIYPSSVVLPVIPDIEVKTDIPDCTALRGQPCKDYKELKNLEKK